MVPLITRLATTSILLLNLIAVGEVVAAPTEHANGNWPFIRGPNFDGRSAETGLIDSFPAAGPPVVWTRPLGVGYSGFTAVNDLLYTQYQTLGGQYVICLNASTGETVWEHRYELPYDPAGMYPGPRATPTLTGEHVYFSAPSGLVGCLDRSTGAVVWQKNLFEALGVELVEFGYSCSPVIVGNKVLLPVGPPNASLVALDALNGSILWKSGNDVVSHVPALPIQWQGKDLVIGYFRNVLAAFDLKTGRVVWRRARSHGYDEHASWPIYQEPYLWVSGPFRAGSELLELTAEPPGYREVWQSKLMSNDVCSSVLVDGFIFGFDIRDQQTKPHRPSRGKFRCLEFLTGKERWANGTDGRRVIDEATGELLSDDDPAGDPQIVGHASVIYADGKLILFNDLGELILARATPDRYDELGRVRVLGGELCWTAPTLSNGRLFVRNHSRIACIELRKQSDRAGTSPYLSVADIPQSTYRDWASLLLAVEPEFAMDLPSNEQLWRWYQASLVILLTSLAVAHAWGWLVARYHSGYANKHLMGIYRGIAFFGGALGTTVLSSLLQRFIFTWPVCLYVVLELAIVYSGRKSERLERWKSRGVLVLFLLTCGVYFLLCRRLSLAFEWVFLGGFVAAIPALSWRARSAAQGQAGVGTDMATAIVAFTAYFGTSIAILLWRYRN